MGAALRVQVFVHDLQHDPVSNNFSCSSVMVTRSFSLFLQIRSGCFSYSVQNEVSHSVCLILPYQNSPGISISRRRKSTRFECQSKNIHDGGNVKKCAVGKYPKSEKHGNTAQFSEVERSGTQENCGGIESGCLLRLHPLPVPRRRQPKRVACIDPDAVVVDKNIAKNDRFDLFSR